MGQGRALTVPSVGCAGGRLRRITQLRPQPGDLRFKGVDTFDLLAEEPVRSTSWLTSPTRISAGRTHTFFWPAPRSGSHPAMSAETNTAAKDPDDWVTGDEAMTGPQASYLETLAREAASRSPTN
jgi:hypothetical protein